MAQKIETSNGLAYYNENDPFAAQWLLNLISAGLIALGDVDTRDIRDVRPADLRPYTQCHFFAGIGGWSLALRLAGWPDDKPVWTGSCPCQPFSGAGKRRGFADERHLWPVWRQLITDYRDAFGPPPTIFGEQVASATQWLALVRSDLEALGYAVGAIPIQAASAGAYHLRDRYWLVAHHQSRGGGIFGPREGVEASAIGTSDQPSGSGANGPMAHSLSGASDGRSEFTRRLSEKRVVADGACAVSERMEHSTSHGRREGRPEHGVRRGRAAIADTGYASNDLGHPSGAGLAFGSLAEIERGSVRDEGPSAGAAGDRCETIEWAIGADGKVRPVKPGVRLLAHGISGRLAIRLSESNAKHWYSRIGALKGFGNAIDPRPAAQFIRATCGAG